MKNWKKLLACLLVSLMALTVFTACDASVGAPMGAKRSTAESAKALCDRFKVSYSEELSDKAYTIASWVAGTEQSCKPSEGKTELYRWASIDKVAEVKTCLEQQRYATAFENMGMGILGTDDFTPGFDIDCTLQNNKADICFVLPKDGRVTDTMTKAAKGKTKLGVAYVVDKGVSYAVVLFG
ncbi:hypothetical protein [Faecalibacterium tardum]|uniref:Lipoprotein n=1 Tax=Faecalibacterium tardum TaxID=3133156 RepID=A0ABV1AZV6_9FIRM